MIGRGREGGKEGGREGGKGGEGGSYTATGRNIQQKLVYTMGSMVDSMLR